jgi:hypothetical protein
MGLELPVVQTMNGPVDKNSLSQGWRFLKAGLDPITFREPQDRTISINQVTARAAR